MAGRHETKWTVVQRLATANEGIVGRDQLRHAGLSDRVITHHRAKGALVLIFRAVFGVGHAAITPRGRRRAALLSVGIDAILSHRSAAAVWRLLDDEAVIEVTVPGRRPRSQRGLRVHTVAALDARDRRVHDGLPLTSPARTVLDLAATEPVDVLARALREARVRWGVRDEELEATIGRAAARHPGVRRLRAAIGATEAAPTRSVLERAMLRLIDDAGLPRPLVNHAEGREIVDFDWPEQRVVVEVDGWHAHGDRRSFEADRARDAARQAGGQVVLRFTWSQVTAERVRVAARIAQTLGVRTGA